MTTKLMGWTAWACVVAFAVTMLFEMSPQRCIGAAVLAVGLAFGCLMRDGMGMK